MPYYHMCDICKKRELGVQSVLGARRHNLSRLRVEKLGCAGSRQVIPAVYLSAPTANEVRVYIKSAGHCVPLACPCVTPPGRSPACTYLKQPWQPLRVFALSQSPRA
jgi:hypothetical protein